MIIAVASGKGGTGKTTVATSLALSLAGRIPVCLLDCDVEAPNAHLFLQPQFDRRAEAELPVPQVDPSLCQRCGICAEVCQYHAIVLLGQVVLVFPELCHGCGSCMLNCPERAISEMPRSLGVLESGRAAGGIRFARGTLNIGEPLAVPVIRQLKQWCEPHSDELVIIDAPPGTSCPVVEAIHGADYVLLVTEPTPFGLHDLRLAVQVARSMKLPIGVVVNRAGSGNAAVDEFCTAEGLPIVMRIPFDRAIAEGIAQGRTLVEIRPDYRHRFWDMFQSLVVPVSAAR